MNSTNQVLSPEHIKDFRSSLVVFLITLPLCLGVAIASGAPAQSGIVAGIIGGVIVGFISSSSLSVSSPSAALIIVIASGLATLGSFAEFALATAVAGGLQMVLSRLRFGVLANFIPSSVVRGMLAAIGLIIILKQIPHLIGFDADAFGEMGFQQADGENTFTEIVKALQYLHWGAVILSALSITTLIVWKKFAKSFKSARFFSAPLIAVLLSIIVNEFLLPVFQLKLEREHLVVIPHFKEFFHLPSLESFNSFYNTDFWIVSLTICLVASVESLLSIDALEKIDPLHRAADEDRELLAQGVGNTLSGLLGGLPISAMVVPTSANITAGALTKISTMLNGLWLLAFVVLFPTYLSKIPLAALATILVVVGFKLTEPKIFKLFSKTDYRQMIPFICTIVAILFTDLLTGVAFGFLVGIIFVVFSSYHSTLFLAVHESDYLLRFHKDTSFLNKPQLKKLLSSIPNNSNVIIDGTRPVFIDDDAVEMIDDFIQAAPAKKISVTLKKSNFALTSYFKDI